jgi:hypothetical protein
MSPFLIPVPSFGFLVLVTMKDFPDVGTYSKLEGDYDIIPVP